MLAKLKQSVLFFCVCASCNQYLSDPMVTFLIIFKFDIKQLSFAADIWTASSMEILNHVKSKTKSFKYCTRQCNCSFLFVVRYLSLIDILKQYCRANFVAVLNFEIDNPLLLSQPLFRAHLLIPCLVECLPSKKAKSLLKRKSFMKIFHLFMYLI